MINRTGGKEETVKMQMFIIYYLCFATYTTAVTDGGMFSELLS